LGISIPASPERLNSTQTVFSETVASGVIVAEGTGVEVSVGSCVGVADGTGSGVLEGSLKVEVGRLVTVGRSTGFSDEGVGLACRWFTLHAVWARRNMKINVKATLNNLGKPFKSPPPFS